MTNLNNNDFKFIMNKFRDHEIALSEMGKEIKANRNRIRELKAKVEILDDFTRNVIAPQVNENSINK